MTVVATNYFRCNGSKPAQVRCEVINMDQLTHTSCRGAGVRDTALPHDGTICKSAQKTILLFVCQLKEMWRTFLKIEPLCFTSVSVLQTAFDLISGVCRRYAGHLRCVGVSAPPLVLFMVQPINDCSNRLKNEQRCFEFLLKAAAFYLAS